MAKFRNGYLLFNTGTQANKILDEDNMVSNDNTALPTQQSVKAYIDNKTISAGSHGLDSTSHIGITGIEDNFMSINDEGLPKDSGKKASDFESAGAVSTHESTYNHLKLHDQIHGLDSTSHIGISGAEDNFMSIDTNGLPKDSGKKASDFVEKGLEDTLIFNAARNSNSTNIYLRNSDSTPTNMSPFILPWNCTLIAISVSTNSSETWIAEVHSGEVLVSGASLSIVANTKSYSASYSINFNAGDPVELYCNGTNIDRPRITVVFRRR